MSSQRLGVGGRTMDQSIPPFGDGENVTLTSTEVPQASMLQTSVHGCDAPVADVTRVLRTCAPLHPARARLMAAAVAPWRKSRCRIESAIVSPGAISLCFMPSFTDRNSRNVRRTRSLQLMA